GWNALSSLAAVDWTIIPNITSEEELFLDEYMSTFLEQKLQSDLTKVVNSQHLQEICKTTKPIVFVPLQVHTDSVITHFVPKNFRDQNVLFDFALSRQDCFFIFKEHPKQEKGASHANRRNGVNYVYLDALSYDTMSMVIHSDICLCLNSTVGFESLYWTPIVRIGRSAYSHDSISYPFRDFAANLPHKKREDVVKFLHYAITKFHYSPGVNATSYLEWFDFVDEFRKKHRSLISRQNRLLVSYPNLVCR
ncbi:hypothetical protein LCGC14_2201280, partial [marine sediment metagenome]